MFTPEFELNQKVKVCENADTREGERGIVTAIYDPSYTPSRYPQGSEYRVTFNNNREDCMYFKEYELEAVVTRTAYCFKNTKSKKYMWCETSKSLKGWVRFQKLDKEFEV